MKFRSWPPFSVRTLLSLWKRDKASELARRVEDAERSARAQHRQSVELLDEAEKLQEDCEQAQRAGGRRP